MLIKSKLIRISDEYSSVWVEQIIEPVEVDIVGEIRLTNSMIIYHEGIAEHIPTDNIFSFECTDCFNNRYYVKKSRITECVISGAITNQIGE